MKLVPLLILMMTAAQAQNTGSISGVVIIGEVLPDAVVSLRSDADRYQLRSDSKGQFLFRDLPAGTYTLEAQVLGFKTFRVPNIGLAAGETKRLPELPLNVADMCGSQHIDYSLARIDVNTEVSGEAFVRPYASSRTLRYSGRVRVVDPNGSVLFESERIRDGRFEFRTPIAGVYRVTFDRRGQPRHDESIWVRPGWHLHLTVAMWEACPDGGCDEKHPARYAICE